MVGGTGSLLLYQNKEYDESMEADKNPMPEFRILPRLCTVGEFVLNHLPTMLPKVPLSRGDHEHGAEAMLAPLTPVYPTSTQSEEWW